MDLIENRSNQQYLIKQADGKQCIINAQTYTSSLIVSASTLINDLACYSVEQISNDVIDTLLSLKPEVILLGTGKSIHYPDTQILSPLLKQKVGFEVMSNASVARTFNVLMSEDRRAACLMLFAQ